MKSANLGAPLELELDDEVELEDELEDEALDEELEFDDELDELELPPVELEELLEELDELDEPEDPPPPQADKRTAHSVIPNTRRLLSIRVQNDRRRPLFSVFMPTPLFYFSAYAATDAKLKSS